MCLMHGRLEADIDFDRLQKELARHSAASQPAVREWALLLQQIKNQTEPEKLKAVNEFFNRRISFDDDMRIWGQSDYWATPVETLAKGRGDCEDFAIAKYFTLKSLNIQNSRLKLVYVKARIGGPASALEQAHMVLAYYESPDSEPLVLDNLISDIRPAARRPDLSPVFSFNSDGIYAGTDGRAAPGRGGVGSLSRWGELLLRARTEGFE